MCVCVNMCVYYILFSKKFNKLCNLVRHDLQHIKYLDGSFNIFESDSFIDSIIHAVKIWDGLWKPFFPAMLLRIAWNMLILFLNDIFKLP